MNVIQTRKPFLIEINEPDQTGSKLELFIWNGEAGDLPTNPTYVFEKDIASYTNKSNVYNISNYIAEYIQYGSNYGEFNTDYFARVRVKRYKNVGGTYTLLNTLDYFALNGTQDINGFDLKLTPESTYYFDSNNLSDYKIAFNTVFGYNRIRHIDIETNVSHISSFTAGKMYYINPFTYMTGNKGIKLQFIGILNNTIHEWIFLPQSECKYTPVSVEFANRYGTIFKTVFFKASKEQFSIENNDFRLLQSVNGNYYSGKQRQTFNTIGKQQFVINSGWVNEDYSEVIKDILMSEYILLDGQYALIDSKSIDIQKHINNKLINYQLTFTLANDFRR